MYIYINRYLIYSLLVINDKYYKYKHQTSHSYPSKLTHCNGIYFDNRIASDPCENTLRKSVNLRGNLVVLSA